MKPLSRAALPITLALWCQGLAAQSSPPAPAFDVAYRAWEVVTDLARLNADPALGGECSKTFRPFVIPGLKRQTLPEQDAAATACVATARAVCANARLKRTPESAGKCGEFKEPSSRASAWPSPGHGPH